MTRGSNESTQLVQACSVACEERVEKWERHDAEHDKITADALGDRAETSRSMVGR